MPTQGNLPAPVALTREKLRCHPQQKLGTIPTNEFENESYEWNLPGFPCQM